MKRQENWSESGPLTSILLLARLGREAGPAVPEIRKTLAGPPRVRAAALAALTRIGPAAAGAVPDLTRIVTAREEPRETQLQAGLALVAAL